MSETTPEANSHGPAPAQYQPAATEPALIPASQVKPEDIGTLAIEYRDGQPVIVISGGTVIPAGLTAVDASENAVATYSVNPTVPVGSTTRGISANNDLYLAVENDLDNLDDFDAEDELVTREER